MASAFGAKRPSTSRTVDDIARMTPAEWREMQDEIQRDYAKKFLGLADAAAQVRRFQRDAEAAKNRQALPTPFVSGMPTVGPALQFEMSSPGAPAPGSGLPLGIPQTPPVPRGLPVEGSGAPLGLTPPTVPGALPVSGAGLPLGPQVGTPGAGYGTGPAQPTPAAPPGASGAAEGGSFDPRLAAMMLASVSDAVKENLTLQGARGAKGTATPNLLAVQQLEQQDARDQMKYRLELTKWLSLQPEQRLKSLTTFADLAAKIGDLASTASPEQAQVMKAGLEQQADQLGMPKSWVGDYMAQGQAALSSIRDLIPHIDPASLQLIMMRARPLLKEGKFLETAQQAANFGIQRSIEDQLPAVLSALDKQPAYQGKDKPFDLVVDLVAGKDNAIRQYMTGVTAPKDQYTRFAARLEGMGVALPESKAAVQEAAAKAGAGEQARQDVLNAPSNVAGAASRAEAMASATEPSRERVAAATGVEAARIGVQKAKEMPVGAGAVNWENDQGKRPPADKGIDWLVTNGFRPTGKLSTEDSRRAIETLLGQIDALVPVLKEKGFLSTQYNFAAVGMAGFNRKLYPGDPDLQKFLVHAGTMVAVGRNLGDIGSRAIQAYESLIDVIRHPTSADATTGAIQQLREAVHAQAGIPPKKTPSGYTIERIR